MPIKKPAFGHCGRELCLPTGPKGERGPAEVIGNAVKIMRIATGEEPEDYGSSAPKRAKGGKARAESRTPQQRGEIAQTAAAAR